VYSRGRGHQIAAPYRGEAPCWKEARKLRSRYSSSGQRFREIRSTRSQKTPMPFLAGKGIRCRLALRFRAPRSQHRRPLAIHPPPQRTGKSPAVINGEVAHLSPLFTWAQKLRLTTHHPVKGIGHLKAPRRERSLSQAEVPRLLAACQGDLRDMAPLALGRACAPRRSWGWTGSTSI
jgi:hypothetical protein